MILNVFEIGINAMLF